MLCVGQNIELKLVFPNKSVLGSSDSRNIVLKLCVSPVIFAVLLRENSWSDYNKNVYKNTFCTQCLHCFNSYKFGGSCCKNKRMSTILLCNQTYTQILK